MVNNIQEPTTSELLHQLAEVWQQFADLCEEQADQIVRELTEPTEN